MQREPSSVTELDEAGLVRAVQGGDAAAYAPLVAHHLPHIHAFIALKLPVPHLVDELAHETFVFAYRQLHAFKAGTSLRAWLRAIAANKVRAEIERYLREQANHLRYTEHRLLELSLAQPDDAVAAEIEAMQDCLGQLPAYQRQLLDWRYHDAVPADEMARRLERSVAWIRTMLFRIRQQLRDCIEAKLAQEAAP
jgi:RNA polymerase sigma-70 factor (ECF subfamily)